MPSNAPTIITTQAWEPDFAAGPVLLGRYRVLGIVGKGGMGLVFKAFHLNLRAMSPSKRCA